MVIGLLLAGVMGTATVVRLAPLIEGGERLQRQCVTEDGYLMLTIARNVSLGRGFSISDGQIPSNGVQPLATLLYALCFAVAGGDKITALYPIVAVQFVLSALTAAVLFRTVGRRWYTGAHATLVALSAALIWYASPTSVMHTQNSLETGLYALLIICSITLWEMLTPRLDRSFGVGSCLVLGLCLGTTFLARNDACLLIGVLLVAHVLRARRTVRFPRALPQAILIGAMSVVTAGPWLWFNVTRFGHVIPISGRAEALHAEFGQNLLPGLVALLEDILLFPRIPSALETLEVTQWLSGLLVVGMVIAAILPRKWLADRFSSGLVALAFFVTALFLYYALMFGAPYFLGRYLFPASVLAAVVVPGAAFSWFRQRPGRMRAWVMFLLIPACAMLSIALNLRIYLGGKKHLHFQVVDWVAGNVAEESWVAAVQTGTLGYYHDRTINLDGKVDPNALAARRQGRIPEYLIERNVDYIVDWYSVGTTWSTLPKLADQFDLVVKDRRHNLSVLKRRSGTGSKESVGTSAVPPGPTGGRA